MSRLSELVSRRVSNMDVAGGRNKSIFSTMTTEEKKHQESALLARQFMAKMNLNTQLNHHLNSSIANSAQASADGRIQAIKKPK